MRTTKASLFLAGGRGSGRPCWALWMRLSSRRCVWLSFKKSSKRLNLIFPLDTCTFTETHMNTQHTFLHDTDKNKEKTCTGAYPSLLEQCEFGLCGFQGLVRFPLFQEVLWNQLDRLFRSGGNTLGQRKLWTNYSKRSPQTPEDCFRTEPAEAAQLLQSLRDVLYGGALGL